MSKLGHLDEIQDQARRREAELNAQGYTTLFTGREAICLKCSALISDPAVHTPVCPGRKETA